jgi:hypothetical protein
VYLNLTKMPSPKFENKQGVSQPKLVQKPRAPVPVPDERDRLRDIIVVIITYPLYPGEQIWQPKPMVGSVVTGAESGPGWVCNLQGRGAEQLVSR